LRSLSPALPLSLLRSTHSQTNSRHDQTHVTNSSCARIDCQARQPTRAARAFIRRRTFFGDDGGFRSSTALAATTGGGGGGGGGGGRGGGGGAKKKWGQEDWRERIASARPGGAVVGNAEQLEQLLEEKRRAEVAEGFYDGEEDEEGGFDEGGDDDDEIVGSFNLDDDDDEDDGNDFIFIPDDPDSSSSKKIGTEEVVDLFLNPAWGLRVIEEEEEELESKSDKRKKKAGSSTSSTSSSTQKEEADAALAAALGLADPRALTDPRSALSSIPKHVLSKLAAEQSAALAANKETAAALRQRKASSDERKLHRVLRLLGGRAAGTRLLSSKGENTRPMMEKVRAALFDMLLSRSPAGAGRMPAGSSWLDLFAGTGSVGLEALSRGASEAHFVEMEPWVVSRVLKPNIASVVKAAEASVEGEGGGWGGVDDDEEDDEEDFDDDDDDDEEFDDEELEEELEENNPSTSFTTTIHSTRAELFVDSYRGKPFDFISVCPPYVKVSYTDLLKAMSKAASEEGRLFHDGSVVIVEYPGRAAREIPHVLGPLVRVRDRKYGRTNVAVYGPRS